jgi:DNA-binding NarL/FixJ family response regulator
LGRKPRKIDYDAFRMASVRAVLLTNDPLLRDGLTALLSNIGGQVPDTLGWRDLEKLFADSRADVVIVTLDKVDKSDLSSLESAKKRMEIPVVGIGDAPSPPGSAVVDKFVLRDSGFKGLREAVESVTHAPSGVREPMAAYGLPAILTRREHQVAKLVAQGYPNRRIASVLGIREQSIKNLVSMIMRKLGCENRTQIALHPLMQER